MTLLDRTAELFRAHPGVWLRAERLQAVGGNCAWRTRISDCRTRLGMSIENRCRVITDLAGHRWTVSEYRYLPPTPTEQAPLDLVACNSESRGV